jgi:hypothetical protein
MKKCCECGKELKLWKGYFHPSIGKKEQVCRQCFNFIEESLKNFSKYLSKESSNKSDEFRDMVKLYLKNRDK